MVSWNFLKVMGLCGACRWAVKSWKLCGIPSIGVSPICFIRPWRNIRYGSIWQSIHLYEWGPLRGNNFHNLLIGTSVKVKCSKPGAWWKISLGSKDMLQTWYRIVGLAYCGV